MDRQNRDCLRRSAPARSLFLVIPEGNLLFAGCGNKAFIVISPCLDTSSPKSGIRENESKNNPAKLANFLAPKKCL
jgi:hypothetical protein